MKKPQGRVWTGIDVVIIASYAAMVVSVCLGWRVIDGWFAAASFGAGLAVMSLLRDETERLEKRLHDLGIDPEKPPR